jgi:hypothetical protein
MYTLAFQLNTIQLAAFQEIQATGALDPYRFGRNHRRPFRHSPASRAFGIWAAALTALAWMGVAVALWRRETALLPVAALWACLWLAHSAVYMDFQYYSLKIPFLVVLGFYCIERMPAWSLPVPGTARRASLSGVLCVVLSASCVANTAWVLW